MLTVEIPRQSLPELCMKWLVLLYSTCACSIYCTVNVAKRTVLYPGTEVYCVNCAVLQKMSVQPQLDEAIGKEANNNWQYRYNAIDKCNWTRKLA